MEESHFKIIFAGSSGSGKTASISSVCDREFSSTEENHRYDEHKVILDDMDQAMDYGQMRLKNSTTIHLYGAPRMDGTDFMCKILSLDALGVILLIDNRAENPLADLDYFLNTFTEHLRNRSVVIGITHMEIARKPGIDVYRTHIKNLDQKIPIFTLDVHDPEMVKILVKTLMYRKDIWLN